MNTEIFGGNMTKLDSNPGKKSSVFKKIFSDNYACWAAILCTVGLMMLVYFCYDLFPFGGKTILRMDMYHQYGPLFAELYDRVTNLESLIYSWRTGLGGPFLGNFFNYLSSPTAILMLILGHQNMTEAIAGMILIKAALSAGSFTYYLKKSQNRHDLTTTAFGILYAMCGYFVAYYWNVMWIDAMVYFPLVILGIENIFNKRSSKCYIAFLALTLLSNYYMGYMTCIFSVIYFIIYFFSKNDFTSIYEDTPFTLSESGKKEYSFKQKLKGSILLKSGIRFALSSIAAAGLVAFALIPTFLILKSCSATSGTMPKLDQYKSYYDIFDFLANHLASVAPTIRSSGEDVLPNVYCGIATLILVPLYLFTKKIPLKEKIANVSLLGIFYFSFNINILNYIWHGFHYPNDLPYRFSFMYCFILLTLAYKAFTNLKEFTGRQILGAGVALIGAIIVIQKLGSKNVEEITVIISIIFTVIYCIIFYISKDNKYKESAVAILLLCCIVGEIACANTDRYSMEQPKANFVGDYSDFRKIKSFLDKKEGSTDYRMELTYNRARMDPAWFGYNGISTFSSMAYEKMANVQSDLGIYGNYINSYTYHIQTPVYNMMHSLKYIVDNDDNVTVDGDYYTEVVSQGKFTAYENKYWLPIGMAADAALKDWYTDFNNPFTVQSDWLEYATGISDVFGLMQFDNIRYYNMNEITSGFESGDLYYSKEGEGTGELTFILTVPEEEHCYLYVNSDDFDEITITRGEKSITQETDEPYIYDLGIVKPGEEVTVFISIEESDYGYIDFYPCYVNNESLDRAYEILKKNSLNVTSSSATEIKGTVNVSKSGVFFTSIPYDKGWTVYIDGKEIKEEDYISLVDAYLAFNIADGEHTIEMKFHQKGLSIGIAVSAGTVLILVIIGIFISLRKKKKEKSALIEETVADDSENMTASEGEDNGEKAEEKIPSEEAPDDVENAVETGRESSAAESEEASSDVEIPSEVLNELFAEFESEDPENADGENIEVSEEAEENPEI
ncbi:MAG: YfhO family protein [Clostridia bacterium]|nr:YfhO family protein [Clostridia bacterium]